MEDSAANTIICCFKMQNGMVKEFYCNKANYPTFSIDIAPALFMSNGNIGPQSLPGWPRSVHLLFSFKRGVGVDSAADGYVKGGLRSVCCSFGNLVLQSSSGRG